MTLRLTNTLTRRTEEFRPISPGQVKIYCCGVTVYDLCHLGHARSYIAWDVLRRYLLSQGYSVVFVQNFTDIDDKILNRASQEGCDMHEISERNIKEFHKDMDSLGILRPDKMPRATQCLDGIRALISELENKGAAYSVEGDVYFSVMKHSAYGRLSRRDLQEQQFNAGGRVKEEEEARKSNPFDFVLWKRAKKGEPSFPSPWGKGRPGWHIECSAMVREELGETIDIHLGGSDLVFPHHENEIAQSETATGKELARYWLHNGMVNVGGQKMSKSLGNFTTIRDLLQNDISPMTLRFFVLQAHYRKPLDFTEEALTAAASGWKGLNRALCLGFTHGSALGWSVQEKELTEKTLEKTFEYSLDENWQKLRQQFIDVMDNDLNTSGALAILFDLARPLRSLANRLERDSKNDLSKEISKDYYCRWKLLIDLAAVLGLTGENCEKSSPFNFDSSDESKIKEAIKMRKQAKLDRDFLKADRIRDELKALGIQLIDKPSGMTDWIRD